MNVSSSLVYSDGDLALLALFLSELWYPTNFPFHVWTRFNSTKFNFNFNFINIARNSQLSKVLYNTKITVKFETGQKIWSLLSLPSPILVITIITIQTTITILTTIWAH